MSEYARHTYGDWCRHDNQDRVGIIRKDVDEKYPWSRTFLVEWNNGQRETMEYQDVNLITEYEYFKVIDPTLCGADLPKNEKRECFFDGKLRHFPVLNIDTEDYF